MTRQENRVLNAREYECGATVLQSRPQFLVIELTQGCNLSCPMCRSSEIAPGKARLDGSKFEAVADTLFSTAEVVDLRGWGESLILPDVVDYIERTSAVGCRIRFVSNLSFNRPQVLEALVRHEVLLTCSIDAAEADVLAALRKGARMNVILDNLRSLTSAYSNVDEIVVLCTVQGPSLASLPKLPAVLAEVGVRQLHFAAVSSKDPVIGLDFSSSFAVSQVAQTMEACRRHSITVTLTTSLPGLSVKPMPRCMRPWTTLYVNYEGRIGYCDHLIGPFAESQLLGTVADGVLNVWNGDAWQRIRARHNAKAPQFKKCLKCYREKGEDFESAWLGKSWM